MKTLRPTLRALLALLLAFASTPAWACFSSCGIQQETSLTCVKICARSSALLTQDGKLDAVSAQACGVQVQDAQATLGATAFELAQPQGALVAFVVASAPEVPLQSGTLLHGRAPPPAPDFLGTYHPLANAPPSYC